MFKNFKLIIEYDGTDYHGWQRQKGVATIQETIESAIKIMADQPVTLIGSGRTDAGVHSLGQVANFKVATKLTPLIFKKGLNSLLPPDIVIKDVEQAPDCFHARYDCNGKCYQYHILNREISSAIHRRFEWHIRRPLSVEAVRDALLCLKGEHDFSAFEAAGSDCKSAVRIVSDIGLDAHKDGKLIFSISANGFLRHMVRNIVGTLVDVGIGRITPKEFNEIFLSKNRANAGATAPPQGLFLMQVFY
jgi:tRNA pseudouridine38-40 synthase